MRVHTPGRGCDERFGELSEWTRPQDTLHIWKEILPYSELSLANLLKVVNGLTDIGS